MKLTLLIIFSFVICTTFAQVRYENGYIINKEGQRGDAQIKNADWYKNPTKIWYKTPQDPTPKSIDVTSIKEFGVGNLRYVLHKVKIDMSSNDPKKFRNRDPEWEEQVVMLKVIVDGKGTLYQYRGQQVERYYYSIDNAPPEPLVYKQYSVNSTVMSNNGYKTQLKEITCRKLSQIEWDKMMYSEPALEKFFKNYNICKKSSYVVRQTEHKALFHVRATPGYHVGKVFSGTSELKGSGYRIGAEAELTLPFNKNKIALFIDPNFQQFSHSAKPKVSYSSLEIPLGLRYNFFIGDQTRIFLDGGLEFDMPTKFDIGNSTADKIHSIGGFAGVGFAANRFSLEARNYFLRPSVSGNAYIYLAYEKVAFVVGYRIF